MTVALMTLVNDVALSPTPGLSERAARAVLRSMAKIAGDDGEFRYGMRQSKVAMLAEYSAATIKRAQRALVSSGLIERVAVGGGRRSTRWRICVDRLRPKATSPPASAARQAPAVEAGATRSMLSGSSRSSCWARVSQQLGRPEPALERTQIFSKSYTPSGPAEPVIEVCEHGNRAGLMPTKGIPWCPSCRRLTRNRR